MLTELKHETLDSEDLDTKLEWAFSRIKRKPQTEKRRKKGNKKVDPNMKESVSVKIQNQSHIIKGVTDKFMYVYQGTHIINKLPHSAYEIVADKAKLRGKVNKKLLKPYRTENDSSSHQNLNNGDGNNAQTMHKQCTRGGLNKHECK